MDTDAVLDAMRTVSRAPLHVRAETVRGHDFGDAAAAEQVTAELKRSAIECVDDEAIVLAIIEAVSCTKRRSPVRWHLTPVTVRGRMA
jgi:predicted P-loop ATPase